jgi:hypothetical protein
MKMNRRTFKNIAYGIAMAGLCLALLPASSAQSTADQKRTSEAKWKNVEGVFGFPGNVQPENVIRFNMPRSDLHVSVAGTEVKPDLALGSWAAFHRIANNDAMLMGDLVLTEDEVVPVMKALRDGGVTVTALHNHLLGESPRVMYLHIGGHGNPERLAQTVKRAVALTKTPAPKPGSSTDQNLGIDVAAVEKIMGHKGKVSGGVLHFNVARAEKVTEDGMQTPPLMGEGTAINFQPTSNGKAAIAGDLALTGKEVESVMKILQENGIESTALHSHALNDVPRLFYMHFWANDDSLKLAKVLRAALDKTNSAK